MFKEISQQIFLAIYDCFFRLTVVKMGNHDPCIVFCICYLAMFGSIMKDGFFYIKKPDNF